MNRLNFDKSQCQVDYLKMLLNLAHYTTELEEYIDQLGSLPSLTDGEIKEYVKTITSSPEFQERYTKVIKWAITRLQSQRPTPKLGQFQCVECKNVLPADFQMKTKGYCYLCDPGMSVKELIAADQDEQSEPLLGQKILRRDYGYPDKPEKWIETTCNETYLQLMKEHPEDYWVKPQYQEPIDWFPVEEKSPPMGHGSPTISIPVLLECEGGGMMVTVYIKDKGWQVEGSPMEGLRLIAWRFLPTGISTSRV